MEQYTVQRGDSLWKISRQFGIDINELANINGLSTKAKQHIIHPGQILNLPSKDTNYDTQLTLRVCDLVWRPLSNAKIKLTFDGRTYDYVTDGSGIVAGVLIKDSTRGIKVELQHLNKKEYIIIANHKKIPLGKLGLRISSREMVIKGSTSVKKGTQQSSKKQEKEKAKQKTSVPSGNKTTENQSPSISQNTRTEGGAPTNVSNIGNVSEGLRLPPEAEQYRDLIIKTAKKYGFQPEGLAALIYAESRWKVNAANLTGSGAVGLGQFKPKTWLIGCADPQSKVYQLITSTYNYSDIKYRNGKLLGVLNNAEEMELNTESILSLRNDSEYNIDMIGLYDRNGVNRLSGFIQGIDSLEPDELMKIAYLVHMNGYFGALDILMNGSEEVGKGEKIPSEKTFEIRLKGNVKDSEKEQRFYAIDNTWRTAYVAWLANYYDSIIVPDHYRISPGNKIYNMKDIIIKLNKNYDLNIELPPVDTTTNTTNLSSNEKSESVTNNWHNPLKVCRIRTQGGLASPKSATFGGWRKPLHGRAYQHQGLDIEAEPGTTIYSVANGRIAFITEPPKGDYGRQLCLIVQRDDLPSDKTSLLPDSEVYFFYAHLSKIYSGISEGKHVSCGEPLGETGSTGNAIKMTTISKGAHLHFEIRTKARLGIGIKGRLDPAPLIDGFNYP